MAPTRTAYQARYQRLRRMALGRLAKRHRDEYLTILDELRVAHAEADQ